MPTKKKPSQPAKTPEPTSATKTQKEIAPAQTTAPEPAQPKLFEADIYVYDRIVSSVGLKAANRTAAMLAINKMINVKVK